MVRRKKKTAVNAIDKYIKQIKYRTECKKIEKAKIRQPRVVISRMRSRPLQVFIDPIILGENENKTSNIEASVEKIPRKRKMVESISAERVCNSVSNDLSQEKKNGTPQPAKSMSNSNQSKTASNDLGKSRKKKVRKKVLPSDNKTAEKESAEKSKLTSKGGKKVKGNIKKSYSRTGSVMKADIVKRRSSTKVMNTTNTSRPNSVSSENHENVLVAAEEPISESQTIETENQECISATEESSQPNRVSDDRCLCEPFNFDIDDFSESNTITSESLLPKKYKSRAEELKSLTAESITKFVIDNQQYYLDFRKSEHVQKVITNAKKRSKNEFKDSFKCNPFDSSQQIAMYLALRDIFHVPAGSFLECRYFFTLLIPEICCQLFAHVFKIKASFAPRLIKKFYSKPVCPV